MVFPDIAFKPHAFIQVTPKVRGDRFHVSILEDGVLRWEHGYVNEAEAHLALDEIDRQILGGGGRVTVAS